MQAVGDAAPGRFAMLPIIQNPKPAGTTGVVVDGAGVGRPPQPLARAGSSRLRLRIETIRAASAANPNMRVVSKGLSNERSALPERRRRSAMRAFWFLNCEASGTGRAQRCRRRPAQAPAPFRAHLLLGLPQTSASSSSTAAPSSGSDASSASTTGSSSDSSAAPATAPGGQLQSTSASGGTSLAAALNRFSTPASGGSSPTAVPRMRGPADQRY